MSDATCKTCPYCEQLGFVRDGCDGECHRKAPRPTRVDFNSSIFYAFWPMVVMKSDWCGEHPDRRPHLECATTTLVTSEANGPTAADLRRIVDALEKMASRAAKP